MIHEIMCDHRALVLMLRRKAASSLQRPVAVLEVCHLQLFYSLPSCNAGCLLCCVREALQIRHSDEALHNNLAERDLQRLLRDLQIRLMLTPIDWR